MQYLAVDLRVGQAMLQHHAGEEMTGMVDVKELVDLSVMQPLFVVVLKGSQFLQHRLTGKQPMSLLHGLNESVAQMLCTIVSVEKRREGRSSTATGLQAPPVPQAEASSTPEHSPHIHMRLFMSMEERHTESSNKQKNLTGTINATQLKPAAHPQRAIFPVLYV